jgi:hypothetical protein
MHALELTIAAEVGDERWPMFAAGWHYRFVDEAPGIGHAESASALAAAGAAQGPSRRDRHPNLAAARHVRASYTNCRCRWIFQALSRSISSRQSSRFFVLIQPRSPGA